MLGIFLNVFVYLFIFLLSHSMYIYSNSGFFNELDEFIDKNKNDTVLSYEIVHRASKEEDDIKSAFIDEIMGDL